MLIATLDVVFEEEERVPYNIQHTSTRAYMCTYFTYARVVVFQRCDWDFGINVDASFGRFMRCSYVTRLSFLLCLTISQRFPYSPSPTRTNSEYLKTTFWACAKGSRLGMCRDQELRSFMSTQVFIFLL
mmetsp:Transcript_21515/g.27729  ORF Transcript_21515/g.27729 Transcript_21515/m.27729 type:complete len:129 (+) Transcript_21515:183-569(+)